jgi:hypothetical protein
MHDNDHNRHERRAADAIGRKVGWRVNEWHAAAGVSRAYTYLLIGRSEIESRTVGRMRIITTPPQEWLDRAGKAA